LPDDQAVVVYFRETPVGLQEAVSDMLRIDLLEFNFHICCFNARKRRMFNCSTGA